MLTECLLVASLGRKMRMKLKSQHTGVRHSKILLQYDCCKLAINSFKKEKVKYCRYYVKTRGSNSKRNGTHFYN